MIGGSDAQEWLDRGLAHQTNAWDELREALSCYECAIELDPSFEKAHYQLVVVYVALGQALDAAAVYQRRLVDSPNDLLAHRCLAQAYVAAGRWDDAGRTIDAGLALAPDDAFLLEQQGALFEGLGHVEQALSAWQRALEADQTSIGGRYSRAFLLERIGRRSAAASEWESILTWLRERGYDEDSEWPERELARLRSA